MTSDPITLARPQGVNEALDLVPDTHLAPLVEYIEKLEASRVSLVDDLSFVRSNFAAGDTKEVARRLDTLLKSTRSS